MDTRGVCALGGCACGRIEDGDAKLMQAARQDNCVARGRLGSQGGVGRAVGIESETSCEWSLGSQQSKKKLASDELVEPESSDSVRARPTRIVHIRTLSRTCSTGTLGSAANSAAAAAACGLGGSGIPSCGKHGGLLAHASIRAL